MKAPPVRDLGPLSWVFDEVEQSLTETVRAVARYVEVCIEARHSDMSEPDGTELRWVGQQLHQAAGVLDMVELPAAARTLRALEAAVQRFLQKPAAVTEDAPGAVRRGTHALIDYLDRLLRGRTVQALDLYATYRQWQQLAGAARAHPADLWTEPHADVLLPPGPVYEPGPVIRAHLDGLVLRVVKALDPQAALALARLSAGLGRHAEAAEVRRFWAVAAAYFEAVASGRLPDDPLVKRAASTVLLRYSQLQHGDVQGLDGHIHDLLFWTTQVRPDAQEAAQRCLQAVWEAHGWTEVLAWNAAHSDLGSYDPTVLRALKTALDATQQSWAALTEADVVSVERLEGILQPLVDGLRALMPAWPVVAQLGDAWAAVAQACRRHGHIPQGLALEASNCLLLLGAELEDFDVQDDSAVARWSTLNQRLNQALAGEAVAEPQDWMTERYRRIGQQATVAQVVAQWQAELHAVEEVLDACYRGQTPVSASVIQELNRRLEGMGGIATLLDLPAARQTVDTVRGALAKLRSDEGEDAAAQLQSVAQQLSTNITALGWMLDTFVRQPDLARASFVFDEARACLQGPSAESVAADAPETGASEASVASAVAPPQDPEPVEGVAEALVEAPEDEEQGLLDIFLGEARSVFEGVSPTLDILRQQPDRLADLTAVRRAFHTLKGSARMVGLSDLGEAAWAMEQLLNAWLAEQKAASAALLDLCQDALTYLQDWVEELAAHRPEVAQRRSDRIAACAHALRLEGRYEPLTPFEASREPAESQLPVLDEVVLTPSADDGAEIPVLDEEIKCIGPLKIGAALYNVFINEADEWSRRLCEGLSEWRSGSARGRPPVGLSAWAHSLAGGAATVGYEGLSQLARALEHALDRLSAPETAAPPDPQADLLVRAGDEIRELLHQFAAGFLRAPNPDVVSALEGVPSQMPQPAEPQSDAREAPQDQAPAAAQPLPSGRVSVDADLIAVFVEEAQDLLPRVSAALRQWADAPHDALARAEVLRNLHTLKGSARLCGEMALGDRFHGLESDVLALPEAPNPEDIAALLHTFDGIVADLEALRQGPAPLAAPVLAAPHARPTGGAGAEVLPPVAKPLPADGGMRALASVRVRPQLLDQLMSQTGDLMIARSRLENDVRALRQSFKDMSGNIERLRAQLRDLEIQTELQMQSRIAQNREADSRFDPLEFDRYTRVQELTRLLAEAVNDVATVQLGLSRSVESAENNLAAQTHITRELQRNLLRTRLVAFSTIEERLHRVVRQAADAAGKLAELTIAQQDIEVDRAVLEKLVPVLEHLLRNAVVHGIEGPAQRVQAGKPEVGQIRLALSVQGNDLSLSLSDDGAGLNVERLQAKAVAAGLHPAGVPLSPEDAVRLIFASGISTASEVTEVAGRGIGLDVVRTEVMGLGGRIECKPPAEGAGTEFRLVVPLSTAVTQVVMLRVGDWVFGVPSPWVDRIRRVKLPELAPAYQSCQWTEGSNNIPFYWAGALLAHSAQSADMSNPEAKYASVIVFWVAGQQVAWHVDEVLGNQEVVVKPMGPQLSRLPGLTGVTVLASGAVALIYNPATLSEAYGHEAWAWMRSPRAARDHPYAAASPGDAEATTKTPLILVVDDSITVRRVTQRLLKREGYRVALAADGQQALERIAEEMPLVVLCDIEMPRMDGFELVQHLRNQPQTASLPVVMITSRLAEKHWEHAKSLGVNHYLGKPYVEEELLQIIDGHVRLATYRA